MSEDFSGKRILVTGASKGLGWVIAQEFARRGGRLVVCGRNEVKLQELKAMLFSSDRHAIFAGDLLDFENIEKLEKRCWEFLGGLDVIIHVAGGGYGFRDPLLSWEQFDKLLKINVSCAVEINRRIIPGMIKSGYGRVVHVGSIAGQEATGSVGYNTVKAGLSGYVRSLGRELAGSGVVVTGILPGAFYAPGNSWERLEENKPEVVKEFINEKLPRGKIAGAEELIPLILLLAGGSASMMAGSCIPIDAGEGKSYVQT
jgi:3-oxoacyl-[acyl-carrier protein] reductase